MSNNDNKKDEDREPYDLNYWIMGLGGILIFMGSACGDPFLLIIGIVIVVAAAPHWGTRQR